MTVQEATEAANINSFQMRSSFGTMSPARAHSAEQRDATVGPRRTAPDGYTEVFEDARPARSTPS